MMTTEIDPGDEVEEQVKRIIDEHIVLWGCDDPVCAVNCSHRTNEPKKRSWWKRLLGLR